jgi:hypothetical protein
VDKNKLTSRSEVTADGVTLNVPNGNVKVRLSLYRPWRHLGLQKVEAPTFSDIQVTDCGKLVGPTCQQLFTPRKIPGTHFC